MLALLDYCDAVESRSVLDRRSSKRKVLGFSIHIRQHNRHAIESHPMAWGIEMLQVGRETLNCRRGAQDRAGYDRVMVCLDSNHTHDHVLAELHTFAPLVSIDSYCIVFDTVIEELPATVLGDRPWTRGNSPMTAVASYLSDIADQRVQGWMASDLPSTLIPRLTVSF